MRVQLSRLGLSIVSRFWVRLKLFASAAVGGRRGQRVALTVRFRRIVAL